MDLVVTLCVAVAWDQDFYFHGPGAKVSSVDIDDFDGDESSHSQLEKESSAFFGSARLWDDAVILPQDTRQVLSVALEACLTHQKVERSSNINAVRM